MSCSLSEWKRPLYDGVSNLLNPCFLHLISSAISVITSGFVLQQIFKYLFFNTFGPYQIKYLFGSVTSIRSVGGFTLLRLNSVIVQVVLLALQFSLISSFSVFIQLIVVAGLVAPLHFIEPTRSVIPCTSLIIYWFLNSFIRTVILIQDIFSQHKVYFVNEVAMTTEIILLLNSMGILTLELWYSPSKELKNYYDLNGWDYTRVRNVYQRFYFTFMKDTFKVAKTTNNVTIGDLPVFTIDAENQVCYNKFLKAWNASVAKTDEANKKLFDDAIKNQKPFHRKYPSVFLPILKTSQFYFLRAAFFDYLTFFSEMCQPFLLKRFLAFASNRYLAHTSNIEKQPAIVGFGIALLIYLVSVVRYISATRVIVNSSTSSQIIIQSISTHVYNKAMSLLPKERKNKTVGEIVSHMAQDVQTLINAPDVLADSIIQPIRLIVYIYILSNFLGAGAFAGLGVALVLIPIATAGYTLVYSQKKIQMKYKDYRAKLTSEILNTIKSIKLYSWESPMLERLFDIRNNKELEILKKVGILTTCIQFIWDSIPFAITISTFVAVSFLANVTLTPEVIFPSLSIFGLLTGPILMLPNIFNQIAESKLALERLSKFFAMEELDSGVERNFKSLKRGDIAVSIKDATFVWTKDNDEETYVRSLYQKRATGPSNPPALKNINFEAKKGELSCIVGKVGSGKTTFLKAILGIMLLDKGSAQVNSTIAYCSQSPWILNTSVRDNILFGRKYDKTRYQACIDACELSKDFEILPDSDETIVGEKGIALSGGQKARISLARAVYSQAEIYVLDDVLSAVDTHVGKNIISHVLGKNGLLKSKTIILATNSVPVLHEADNIVLLLRGEILERGTFDQVMSNESDLSKLIFEFTKKANEDETENFHPEKSEFEDELENAQREETALKRIDTRASTVTSLVSFGHVYDNDIEEPTSRRTQQEEEIKNKGKVDLTIYWNYIEACGPKFVALYFIFVIFSTLVSVGNTYLLKYWSEENVKAGHNVYIAFFLLSYAIVGVCGMIFAVISSLIIRTIVAINGSKYFHDTMARAVLRSPMSFFETTPIGRILNRFTEDMNILDSQLIFAVTMFVNLSFKAITVFIVVIINIPFMVLVLFVLLFFYDSYRRNFIPASRELKRLSSASKSPTYSHLQESVVGVDTIIAYGQLERFQYKCSANLTNQVKVNQSNMGANRWLSMGLLGLSAIVVYVSTLLLLMSLVGSSPISPGTVGFIMAYVLDVTGTLNSIVRTYADIETRSITIERLLEYCNLKPEAEPILERRPPDNWPEHGEVKFVGYETKYREGLDPVLKGISIDVKPREKVGIVGRTGAGKSTLTLALFRIIGATGGYIEIDGINTNEIGLFDLRSKLNIIPQDSQAIEGSIRLNLDPFGKFSDDQLWRALEMAHLKEHVASMTTEEKSNGENPANLKMTTGLDAIVDEGGSNLSAGQKQLLCLARALLSPSKILVLDEATASVDVQTDKIVQDTIRSEFKDKTILTIAHRLETIMDSDKILVLDRGNVSEFGSPQELLENKGIFYSLAREGGHI